MPLIVRNLLAMRDLGLVLATGSGDLERPVSWVAVSELPDPSPWLEGGEFLLTTGIRLSSDQAACTEYVGHLVRAGISALGFGVGLSYSEVPVALLTVAEANGITVIIVPEATPFVAISRAVSQWLSAQEHEESARAFTAQRDLIRSALTTSSDTSSTLSVLARHLGGFAIHVDASGKEIASFPNEARSQAQRYRSDIDRMRPRGLLAATAVSSADEHVVLVPLGIRGAATGFLIVGTTRPIGLVDQAVLNLAVSLLSWAKSRPMSNDTELAALRAFLFQRASKESISKSTWAALGVAESRVHLIRIRLEASQNSEDLAALLASVSLESGSLWMQTDISGIAGIVPEGSAESLIRILPLVRSCGVSAPFELDDPVRFRAALEQANLASVSRTGLVYHEQLAGLGFSSLVDARTASSWAAEYISGVSSSPESAELLATFRAWLGHHGQVDAAAAELGVHRHTVRHRLRRAETLLNRDLDDPSVRADLWFALQSLDEPMIQNG